MSLLRDYAARLGQPLLDGVPGDGVARHDEVVAPDGSLRGPWRALAEQVVGLTADDVRRVHEEVARALADDGVTHSRAGGRRAAWRLDPVPLLLDAASWARLEVGLAQRAELLNAVLTDLYGERRLLREGVVPSAVVLGHPGYVRAVARPSAVDPRPLVLAGVDLGRDASGAWQVLSDKVQGPSGLGYALENRRVLGRVLPGLQRQAVPHRLEPFVHALRSALLQSASDDRADPRVVVLSPGPGSPTAFDQAFLASALGFPLVQGRDLVVRDGWVMMRVVGRLERVDVVHCRVDAAWADPLELRGDSRLGVAGLLEAGRRGRVRIVNGLGAGVLENPALAPYLPAACEALLGEPLRLPGVPAWWCGAAEGLGLALDHLDALAHGRDETRAHPDGLSVRPIDSLRPAEVEPGDAADLAARVRAEPHRYVVSVRPRLSQAPTWTGSPTSPVEPHPLTMRAFVLRYGSAYRPLMGGLAGVVEGDRTPASRDVWVLKATPGEPDQGLADVLPLTAARTSTSTVPRVLESMWWAGRYAERAEDLLRLVLATHQLADDRAGTTDGLEVVAGAVARLAGRVHDDLDAELASVLLDRDRPGTVAHSVEGLRDALDGVRDQLSPDVWRVFGSAGRAAAVLTAHPRGAQVAESAGRMLTGVLALQGVTASMIRDPGWHVMALGRHLERSRQLVHLLAATATVRRGADVDREVLDAVLVGAESAVTHRRRYRGYVRTGSVLELLLRDAENPRSLAFCLDAAAGHLAALPASTGSTRPERLLADLSAEVEAADVATLVAIGGVGRPNLAALLDRAGLRLDALAEAVTDVHLTAGPAPRPLSALDLVASLDDVPTPTGVAR